MKYIYTFIASTIILTSCAEKAEISVEDVIKSQDLSQMREKKKEIETTQKEINIQLEALVSAISVYDTMKRLPLVTTFTSTATVFNHHVELQGNVTTKKNVLVYPEVPGIIKDIRVKEGQRVSKGTLLAILSDGGLADQLAQLETQTKLAKTTYERQQKLWEQKIGSEIEYLKAETNYYANINAIKQLKSQYAKTRIVAPFSGIIDDIFKEEGMVIAPGQGSELLRIVNLDDMYIDAEVPESYITSVSKGKHVEVYFPILNKTVEAEVRHAASYVNPSNRTFKVEVKVPNPKHDIKPNLTAKLKINDYKNEAAILIPQSIISENANGDQYIYIIANKKANGEAVVKRKIIETGKTQGDIIEILTAFPNGLEIINEGARSVTDGQSVKILSNEPLKL
ncbi:efflux RND transporter periplasmic adaptor subunit [Flavicella sp.]|uniref:efflux RND transporter periplasmic adaptor subunit n=1 Tax=Flavicella sp. TaxID=2957742 RepID=UPI00261D8BA4|nr:efflux RND transporter periplasmic adaptor subunit [Flavicella sp.]MDG1805327.1 efflux RND transporter periplasmic adaptor subunit [Flavicella sp.]